MLNNSSNQRTKLSEGSLLQIKTSLMTTKKTKRIIEMTKRKKTNNIVSSRKIWRRRKKIVDLFKLLRSIVTQFKISH